MTTTDQPTRDKRRTLTIRLCTIAVALYWVSLYLFAPTLPTYVASKVPDLRTVGIILSMYGLWQAIIRIPLGISSDWVGRRKPFIVGGLLLGAVGALVLGFSGRASGLLLGRAITGMAAGTWVPLVVFFSSLFPAKDAVRASSMLTLAGSVGRVMATFVTGFLNNAFDYWVPFAGAALAAVIAAIVILPSHEERIAPKRPTLASVGRLIARRDVLMPSILSMILMYGNWSSTFSFIPLLAKGLGASDVMLSLMLSLNIVMIMLGNLLSTALVKRIGARSMIYICFGFLGVGIVSAAFAPTLPLLFLAQFCVGMAQGTGYPVLMGLSIRDVDNAQRTTAMGTHQSVYAIGMFAGPAVGGLLADALGIPPMLIITGIVSSGLGLLLTKVLGVGSRED